MKFNMEALVGQIETGLKKQLGDVLEGTSEQLDGPVRLAAQQLAMAARRNKPELAAEVQDTLALAIMEAELRTKSVWGGMIDLAISVAVGSLLDGALGGLAALEQ